MGEVNMELGVWRKRELEAGKDEVRLRADENVLERDTGVGSL